MLKKPRGVLILLAIFCFTTTFSFAAPGAKAPATAAITVDAKSAILIDAGTGTVLFEKNAHEKLPPASVTKVMSMLLSMEALESGQITLQDKVTISDRAASMGGSQLFMEAGEQQTVEVLLKGISIASAKAFCD